MRLSIACVIALSASAATTAAVVPTPERIAATVRAHGAHRAVDRLSDSQWDAIIDRMERGEAAWIALAPQLAPGSDAGRSEELGIALAFALPRNPHAVLAALDPHDGIVLGARRVCGRPFIEDSEPRGYVSRAEWAVAQVIDSRFARAKAACLDALAAAGRVRGR
jgi:hypothetical protein